MADCTLCGCRWINGYMGCSRPNCNEYRLVTERNEWPVQLGLSIRRFSRRADVEGLVEVVERRMEHSPACDYVMYGDVACDCDIGRASDALSRLAALAMLEVE